MSQRERLAAFTLALLFLSATMACGPVFVPEPSPTTDLTSLPLGEAVRTIFEQKCAGCHDNGQGQGGMDFILDAAALRDREKVVPGEPQASAIWLRITDPDPIRAMPPSTSGLSVSDLERDLIRQWIEAGATDFEVSIEVPYISLEEAISVMARDVRSLSEKPRQLTRYISLVPLSNQGVGDSVQSQDPGHLSLSDYRGAVSALLNSLSWQEELAAPVRVDEAGTILRIDIMDYSWDEIRDPIQGLDFWQVLENAYPYPVLSSSDDFTDLQAETGTSLPFINAGWLLANASRAPLYNDALQLPETLQGVEALLGVDLEYNRANQRSLRAGFNDSGVSGNNRLIERQPTSFGAYWQSFDFASNSGLQDIFTYPVTFHADGGEAIWNLPNGLQAYMIALADGTRIDEAPTEIVRDESRADGVVRNGLSCFNCHGSQGILRTDDMVRDHVEDNVVSYDQETIDTVRDLHRATPFAEVQEEDGQRYSQSMDELGLPDRGAGLIPLASLKYEGLVSLSTAAAELGLTVDELRGALDANNLPAGDFVELLPLLGEGGLVFRDSFLTVLPALNCYLAQRYLNRTGEEAGHTGCP